MRHSQHICDAIKQNESELEQNKKNQFSFSLYPQFVELKIKDTVFQIYSYFSAAQNTKIQRKLNAISGCLSKSISASSD